MVLGTMKSCRESIAAAYDDTVTEISDVAALQLLTDTIFLEMALSGHEIGEFSRIKERLIEKVSLCLNSLTIVPGWSSSEIIVSVKDLLEKDFFIVWHTTYRRFPKCGRIMMYSRNTKL
jgi:hypothetical protein